MFSDHFFPKFILNFENLEFFQNFTPRGAYFGPSGMLFKSFLFLECEHGYFKPLDRCWTFSIFALAFCNTCRINFIQSALDKAMSRASQKNVFGKFGLFLTSLHSFEVRGLLSFIKNIRIFYPHPRFKCMKNPLWWTQISKYSFLCIVWTSFKVR